MTLSVRLRHAFSGFELDVRFDAPPGVTVLFGRSGSGKTTVVNAVAGLMRPDEGRIAIGERLLSDTSVGYFRPTHLRRIGYVFQDARLFPHLTVRQNLLYGRWFAPKTARGESLDKVVRLLDLAPLLDRRPRHLSGGEKQRVAIGRALLSCPRLILADEPLASLDEARKAEILPYFERLRDELSVPMLYVSHAAAEVARLATTVVVLERGRVTAMGPATDVLSDPGVTPLGPGAAGAMLQARVVAHHDDGISSLDAGGFTLLVPQVGQMPGADVRVFVRAQDVMLARVRPEGLSALNVLPVTVQSVRAGQGPGAMVQLRAGDTRLLARVTQRSAQAMNLSPGQQVFAVLKAVSVAKGNLGAPPDHGY